MRTSKEKYVMSIAFAAAKRSSCPKSQVGAVFITEDYEVIGTGYNGSAKGLPHCLDAGCNKDHAGKCTRAVHAEMNAIIQAAKRGTRLEDSSCYVTRWPCFRCAYALINLGVKAVIVPSNGKQNPEGFKVLKEGNISKFILHEDGALHKMS